MMRKIQSAFDSVIGSGTVLEKTQRIGATLAVSAILYASPALAQSGGDFCSTSGGQFMSALQMGTAGIALAAFVIMLLLTVVAKMLPFKGASKLGNIGAGGFVSGVLILTIGVSLLQWALTFTPFAANMSCGGIL